MIYFDHNATAPMLPEAQQAWLEASQQFPGNPSSPHRIGARADAALTRAREQLANLLDCDPLDLVWTSGATESNNAALHHASTTLPADQSIWLSAIEHPCLLAAAQRWFPNRHRFIPVTPDGIVDPDPLRAEWQHNRPGLLAVMAANNETGVLQPWPELAALCREFQIPFLCDAAQWLGRLPARGLGACDFVSGCAHKFGGPKGVGFLKCPSRSHLTPLIVGGPQEDGRRAGTENVPAILAMVAALQIREQAIARNEHKALGARLEAFESRLLLNLPGSVIVGANSPRLWNTISALMPETDCRQRWVVKLDKAGVAVSTGSACASGKENPSHVLAAMGFRPEEASRVLRFSAGWETTDTDWQILEQALATVHQSLLESTA